jgi:hypothetical protein
MANRNHKNSNNGGYKMNTMLRSWIAMSFLLGMGLLAACGTPQAPEPTSTPLPPPTNTLLPTDTATPTVDTPATQAAQQTADAQATADARAATETQAAQDKAATATGIASLKQTSTAAVQATATSYANTFLNVIEKLRDEGVVKSENGDYARPDDFQQEWAQLGWYRWWGTGYTAENFVLSADVAWQSASNTADWYTTGCGIVFSLDDEDNHHLVFLNLDGYGVLARNAKGDLKVMAAQRYGKVSTPDGNVKIMLVVDDKRINFYVNDQLVTKAYDSSLNEGAIALTLLSGTNKDFGTRCKMTNIELFGFK